MKTCSRCNEALPLDQFFKNCRSHDGLQPRCKRCHYVYAKSWDNQNKERRKEIGRRSYAKRKDRHRETTLIWRSKNSERVRQSRRNNLLEKYGLTRASHAAMLTAQGGRCAICGGTNWARALAIDHCHATGMVRGLLCDGCNKGVGHFSDSPTLLRAAADYIERSAAKKTA